MQKTAYNPDSYADRYDDNDNRNLIPGFWRQEIDPEFANIEVDQDNNVLTYTNRLRNTLMEYFLSPSESVPWQKDYCNHVF